MLKFKTKTMESFELSIDGSAFSSSEIYKAITKGSTNSLLTAIYQVTVNFHKLLKTNEHHFLGSFCIPDVIHKLSHRHYNFQEKETVTLL